MTTTTTATQTRIVIAGVDTHADTHDVTVLGLDGGWLGHQQFPATLSGYRDLLDWVASFGVIDRIGIELTGSYGAGLTRFLIGHGIEVLEIDIPHHHTRARKGKDDRIDSEAAARKVLSGEATTIPKDSSGIVEAIRLLKVARDSAVKSRTIALQNIRDELVTAPAVLRESVSHLKTLQAKAKHFATVRPDPTRLADPTQAAKTALRRLGKRVLFLTEEITDADQEMAALVARVAPTLLSLDRVGTQHAAQLLITAGGNPDRIRSEAAFARLCGVAPVPISSGKTHRMRLHRGGDRQANKTLYMITINRLGGHQPSKDYMERRTREGLSKQDVIRCLKRFIAREVFKALQADYTALRTRA
jgi:transposase